MDNYVVKGRQTSSMEKKRLEYAPMFRVPQELQEKHEVCMLEITGDARHSITKMATQ